MRNVSNRMKSVIVQAIATLRPDVFYTAGDVIHHAQSIDTRAKYLDGRNVSRYLCVLKKKGIVEMHPRGIVDDAGSITRQRTFTVVTDQ